MYKVGDRVKIITNRNSPYGNCEDIKEREGQIVTITDIRDMVYFPTVYQFVDGTNHYMQDVNFELVTTFLVGTKVKAVECGRWYDRYVSRVEGEIGEILKYDSTDDTYQIAFPSHSCLWLESANVVEYTPPEPKPLTIGAKVKIVPDAEGKIRLGMDGFAGETGTILFQEEGGSFRVQLTRDWFYLAPENLEVIEEVEEVKITVEPKKPLLEIGTKVSIKLCGENFDDFAKERLTQIGTINMVDEPSEVPYLVAFEDDLVWLRAGNVEPYIEPKTPVLFEVGTKVIVKAFSTQGTITKVDADDERMPYFVAVNGMNLWLTADNVEKYVEPTITLTPAPEPVEDFDISSRYRPQVGDTVTLAYGDKKPEFEVIAKDPLNPTVITIKNDEDRFIIPCQLVEFVKTNEGEPVLVIGTKIKLKETGKIYTIAGWKSYFCFPIDYFYKDEKGNHIMVTRDKFDLATSKDAEVGDKIKIIPNRKSFFGMCEDIKEIEGQEVTIIGKGSGLCHSDGLNYKVEDNKGGYHIVRPENFELV